MTASGDRVAAVVQARTASTRLPGKILLPIGRRPLVFEIVARARGARRVDEVGVATTVDATDDRLAKECLARGVPLHRGPVDDIVERLVGAARSWEADVLVRLWGDCPFVAPEVLDEAIEKLFATNAHMVTNSLFGRRTYPGGLDVEVYRRELLESIQRSTEDPKLREFPAEWVLANRDSVRIETLDLDRDLSALHLTVDYPEDLEAARRIYEALGMRSAGPSLDELLRLLADRPELVAFSVAERNPEYRSYLEERGRA